MDRRAVSPFIYKNFVKAFSTIPRWTSFKGRLMYTAILGLI